MLQRRTRPALRRHGHHALGAPDPATSVPDLRPILRRRQGREEPGKLNATEEEGYEVGYGRPPKKTGWKKGQSGNAGPKKRKLASTMEIIDRLLAEPVEIIENGIPRKVSTL